MEISQTEVNLLRLLDSAPRQKNEAKLIHYVTTSRELLEKLAAENPSEAISCVLKAKLNDYSDKIKELAARLASEMPDHASKVQDTIEEKNTAEVEKVVSLIDLSSGLRRRFISELGMEKLFVRTKEMLEHLLDWMKQLGLTMRNIESCKRI